MSNILEYNTLKNSSDTDRRYNSHYQFLPINTSDSERPSMGGNLLDNQSILPTNLFLNFRKNSIVATFMFIYISVYLGSQVLQISPLISSHSHNVITSSSFAYNLLFSSLISYFLFTFSNIRAKKLNITALIIYWFSCTAGAIGFALLGEVPFLKDITITKGWLSSLTAAAFCVVVVFTTLIFSIGIKEYYTKIIFGDKCRSFFKIISLTVFYYGIFIILKISGATNIHYHVHHAICAGFMSLWFIDWDKYIELILHAVLMGVVVEGIDFYGIQELFLLLSNNGSVHLNITLIVYGCFTLYMFLAIGVLKKSYLN